MISMIAWRRHRKSYIIFEAMLTAHFRRCQFDRSAILTSNEILLSNKKSKGETLQKIKQTLRLLNRIFN